MLRRFLLALSFTNLCYAPVWKHLLDIPQARLALASDIPGPGDYLAAICGVIVFAFAITMADTALRRGPAALRTAAAAAAFAFMLLRVRSLIPGAAAAEFEMRFVHNAAWILAACCGAASIAVVPRLQRNAMHAAAIFLLACAPFCAITFGRSLYRSFNPVIAPAPPLAPRLPSHAPRVVWVIFDEWDKRLTYDARPAGFALPALDRLRAESFFAENALPPAPNTLTSMPSLIEGRVVRSTTERSISDIELHYQDGSLQRLGDAPNLFSDARRAGFNAAAFGWYLPYCRIFAASLTDCWWREMDERWNAPGGAFAEALIEQPRALIEGAFFDPFGQSLRVQKHRETYEDVLRRGIEIIGDPGVNLALLHFDVPHAPYFYDRASADMSRSWSTYMDAVALVDRTVAELRQNMERTGAWKTTALLISSDHFWRNSPLVNGKRDERVPFILHLPGQTEPVILREPFNTVLTHDLLLAILRSDIDSVAGARAWLAQRIR